MARDSERPFFIDGLSSVKAASRTSGGKRKPRTRNSRTRLPALDSPPDKTAAKTNPAKKIGHTVEPNRYAIICYECDYEFMLTGHLQDTTCPKCHHLLKFVQYTIDEPRDKPVSTIGSIEVTSTGVITNTSIKARNIILAGDASSSIVSAQERLQLRQGALFDPEKIFTKDLIVGSGVEVRLPSKMLCRDVDVAGTLHASIIADGTIIIRSGGLLRGEIHGPGLVMEEGAGLRAKIAIGIGRYTHVS